MKKHLKSIKLLALGLLISCLPTVLTGQNIKGNKNVISEERQVGEFQKIEAGGAFNVLISQGETTSVIVRTDENLMEHINTEVIGNTLKLSSKGLRNPTKLDVVITNPHFTTLEVSGAANLRSQGIIDEPTMEITASGASEVELNVKTENLKTEASGASYVKLTGTATVHTIEASGASEVNAKNLETSTTIADASGASDVSVGASDEVRRETSGAGSVSVAGSSGVSTTEKTTTTTYTYNSGSSNVNAWENGDTTTVNVGSLKVQVVEGDSTKVTVGKHQLVVDDDGNVKWERNCNRKFNGHWGGFDLGINGFVDEDFNIDPPAAYDFLTLKYEKSVEVNINAYEQNINLANNKFGMITGIGLRWNNYRFADNIYLTPDSAQIAGWPDNSHTWEKSKLVVNYLTVPLLLEYQTNAYSKSNSFHITAGVIAGWRYASHTKMMYNDDGRAKPKEWDSFHLNPFRYDATVRIGWGVVNLYATYSLNKMFKDGDGPELYPVTMGLTLVGW
jgi:hypothetical protein